MDLEKELTIHESANKSIVDDNYKPKEKINLNSFKKLTVTKDTIEKYKDKLKVLGGIDPKYSITGYLYIDKDDNPVAVFMVCYDSYKIKWLHSLEIVKKYRGCGLSKQLLDVATKELGATDLAVAKDNKLAIKIYKDYGFDTYWEQGKDYWMSTNPSYSLEKTKEYNASIREEKKSKPTNESVSYSSIIMDDSLTANEKSAILLCEAADLLIEDTKLMDDCLNEAVEKTDEDVMRKIVKLIKAETDKYASGGPAGNQNCQLCTWSAEMQFRGKKVLPRPVYSPRDIIFTLNGYDIIKNAKKITISNKEDVEKIVLDAGPGSRFYVHVNWQGKSSGHEFLLLNNEGKVYVVDGQAGRFESLSNKDGIYYFNKINFKNSYLVRMDNNPIDYNILKYNNLKYLIKWDEDLDVKFLKENNMM